MLSQALKGRRGQATFAQAGEHVEEVPKQEEGEGQATAVAVDEAPMKQAKQVEEVEQAEGQAAPSAELVSEENASQAQDGETVPAALPTDEVEGADQALENLLSAIQEEAALETPEAPEVASSAEPSPSVDSPSSAESPSSLLDEYLSPSSASPSAPPPPPEPAAPPRGANLDPSGPQLSDVFALRPKRFRIPTVDSPDSHRLVYKQAWTDAHKRFARAFTKQQLFVLAGPDGLDLDLENPRLRSGTPGRKHKWWKSKRLDQMSKSELIQAMLVIEFGMVHPDTLVSAGKNAPQTSEILPLSNRTLFLLLSPKSPTIPNLARQLGVKTSFRRDPETGVVNLLLKGSASAVASAKEEIEMVDELRTVEARTLSLPLPATTLRPEVYQSISRACKVFLSPIPDSPTSLEGVAIDPSNLRRAERLLHSAFSSAASRIGTALFASLPSNLSSLRYAMFPLTPLVAPSPLASSGAAAFARVKTLSIAALPPGAASAASASQAEYPDARPSEPDAYAAEQQLQEWTARMRLERTDRVGMRIPLFASSSPLAARSATLLGMLKAPFATPVGTEGKVWQAERVEVKARFGHVAWPLYGQGEGCQGLGPVLAGQWPWENFRTWLEKRRDEVKPVFVPSPPTGLLQASGVFSPPPTAPSPLSSIFSSLTPAFHASSAEDGSSLSTAQLADLAAHPTMESNEVRRWVYTPVEAPKDGRPAERIEVEMETRGWGVEERVQKVEVKAVKESKADLMVPTAALDAQFSMNSSRVLREDEYPAGLQAALDSTRGVFPPINLEYTSPYMLTTDRLIRRTLITPPTPPPTADGETATPVYAQLQERWTSLHPPSRDAATSEAQERGVDVSLVLTPEGGEDLEKVGRGGAWKRAVEEVENRCARREGEKPTQTRVFGRR
ncbi:hypothetical protein JCM10213v2_002955 [Rhodosporidiobolus nylandii]